MCPSGFPGSEQTEIRSDEKYQISGHVGLRHRERETSVRNF